MDIEYSYYHLTSRSLPNVLSDPKDKEFLGVFLRIDGQYYLDYFPWTVFGDLNRDDFLQSIRKNGLPQFMLDLLALERNRQNISHTPFLNHGFNQVADVTKVKVFSLDEVELTLSKAKGRVRLDFNNAYPDQEVMSWWSQLPEEIQEKIDYIEDPCTPELFETLKMQGMPIASDRVIYNCEIKIYKPNIEVQKKARQLIFSSYMSHDLGRYHAYLALLAHGDKELIHGINTPGIYNEQKLLFNQKNLTCEIDLNVVEQIYHDLGQLKCTSL